MSTNQNPITAAQVGKLIQTLNGVDATRFHELGIPLAHLLAEYLRQENLRPLSLMSVRQMLGLALKPDMVFARVLWTKRIPKERLSEHATRPSGQKQMWTDLVRLYPEDLGLVSEDVQPEDVFHLAMQWGFSLIPTEVASAFLRSSFAGEKRAGGLAAFLDFNDAIKQMNLEIVNRSRDWVVSQASAAGLRRRPSLIASEDWSILMASETREEVRK
jgi:hypothetical protein